MKANHGNWAYFSGVGGDPKNRHFRTTSQLLRYDRRGNYICKWLKICSQDEEAALRPWDFEEEWPTPIVHPHSQLTFHDKDRFETTGSIMPLP
jgi:deoxyribodipyrimidine photolyase